MTTSAIKPSDIVEVDKKGRRFYAMIEARPRPGDSSGFRIRPLTRGYSYARCTAREIVGIWHANKTTAERRFL